MTDFCEDFGMSINMKKTMFMVIKGNAEDREPITAGRSTIHHCDSYTYLGSLFSADTSFTSFLKAHTSVKNNHLLKLYAFLRKNPDITFICKQKVLRSCHLSAVLYGCESWYSNKLKTLNTLNMPSIKAI